LRRQAIRLILNGDCTKDYAFAQTNSQIRTECSTQNMVAALSAKQGSQLIDQFIWIPRYNGGHNNKPNPIFPAVNDYRVQYLTIPISVCAGESIISETMGYSGHEPATKLPSGVHAGYLDITESCGLPDTSVWSYSQFVAEASPKCVTPWPVQSRRSLYHTCINIVVLPEARFSDLKKSNRSGIIIDFERQDGIGSSQAIAELKDIVALVHGKICVSDSPCSLDLYTNRLDGPMAAYNGIFGKASAYADADKIMDIVDHFDLLLSSTSDPSVSFISQLGQFERPRLGKMQIIWDMRNTIADAKMLRRIVARDGPAGIQVWMNGTSADGHQLSPQALESVCILIGISC
jgi:hypothetical protein